MEFSSKKDIYSLYDWRDPICVSHYPFPEEKPDSKDLINLIGLGEENNQNEPKALYVHIPFCDKICSFCPFNKVLKKEDLVEKYISALEREINSYAQTKYVKTSHFGAVNFGGGTPSSLRAEQLVKIISFIKEKLIIDPDAFISVEGSPSNFSEDKLAALYKIGVNRVSFGVQTFNQKLGEVIELPQSSTRSIEILKNARKIGYNNICIDFIYNLPSQSIEDWKEDVQKAIVFSLT
jgi:oxygen-independent coproporphyrinogen-3 oxidase